MSKQSVEKNLSVKGFMLKILIWLPLTFILWYLLTPFIISITALLTKAVLGLVAGHAVMDVEQVGHSMNIVTRFAKDASNSGALAFEIDVMKYAYGLALFPAMVLATPKPWKNKLQDLTIGILVLFVVILWGVSFDSIQTLVFKLGRDIGITMGTTPFIREAIVLGYQLGYLILPAVAPIVLWFSMNQEQVVKLAPKFAKKAAREAARKNTKKP